MSLCTLLFTTREKIIVMLHVGYKKEKKRVLMYVYAYLSSTTRTVRVYLLDAINNNYRIFRDKYYMTYNPYPY